MVELCGVVELSSVEGLEGRLKRMRGILDSLKLPLPIGALVIPLFGFGFGIEKFEGTQEVWRFWASSPSTQGVWVQSSAFRGPVKGLG